MCKNQGGEIVLIRITILINQLRTQFENNPNEWCEKFYVKRAYPKELD